MWLLSGILLSGSAAQDKKALTVTDLMKFRQMEHPSVSMDGKWVMLTARPDRGDPEVQVISGDGKVRHTIGYAEKPVFSNDGNWVAAREVVSLEQQLKSMKGKDKENGPRPGLVLLDNRTGNREYFQRVSSYRFSEDNKWLIYRCFPEDAKRDDKTGELVLRSLREPFSVTYPFVTSYSADSTSRYLAFVVMDTSGNENGVYLTDLNEPGGEPAIIFGDSAAWGDQLSWDPQGRLAFLGGILDVKKNRGETTLYLWKPGNEKASPALEPADLPGDWVLYHTNRLRWSEDGERLFLGLKPPSEILPEPEDDSLTDPYDTQQILSKKGVDVWHWNDPYIIPQQKKQWKNEKDKTYAAVYLPGEDRLVTLADTLVPDVRFSENKQRLLAYSNVPYARRVTWEGRIMDYYLTDLSTGQRRPLVKGQKHTVRLSPDGRYAVYFRDGDWYLVDAISLEKRNLTGQLGVSFANEDWDYPADTPGYGVAGWLDHSEAVLIYDKFDIWQFDTGDGKATCLTGGEGRDGLYRFRIQKLDPERKFFEKGDKLFLTATHDSLKHTSLYAMKAGKTGVSKLMDGPWKYTLLTRAEEEDRILFTRESYREFPDLWITGPKFRDPVRLSELNPQVSEFDWGHAQLVEWNSLDGKPLQGILITPEGHRPGEQLPVLVYYYRFFSDRLYEFNHVAVNHRPCFPYYVSNGYAMFLPDIRFDVGTPGYAATKCLVPGVQKIIDMGVADPDAICLHGHSWSGYQTAFVVTQTDLFACAIAGAPVSNMTSAYSGIRWESGMARQFQYEQSQSRIGGSLWEARDKYIENSPVFFADRINTPLLIQFGDEDGAVPWYQGIELYLAMRRLDKDCIFLQYRGEPHHLKQYGNKLDYTLKFRQYLDHYLKGEPPAEWISNGIPYRGE